MASSDLDVASSCSRTRSRRASMMAAWIVRPEAANAYSAARRERNIACATSAAEMPLQALREMNSRPCWR